MNIGRSSLADEKDTIELMQRLIDEAGNIILVGDCNVNDGTRSYLCIAGFIGEVRKISLQNQFGLIPYGFSLTVNLHRVIQFYSYGAPLLSADTNIKSASETFLLGVRLREKGRISIYTGDDVGEGVYLTGRIEGISLRDLLDNPEIFDYNSCLREVGVGI